jgi:N-acetylglucosamine-6-sulfatase
MIDALVANIDIAPVIADLAGNQLAERADGRTLVPLLKGRTSGWRDDLLEG